jgi:peptidoglycan hydrolase-like protein with peptidoglycan-binding domain
VTRQTLTETEDVNGVLGYGGATAVSARAPLARSARQTANVFTWLPADGALISRGQPLYRVDNEPVPLIYGAVPPYRVLRDGLQGPDVAELESNLKALGYTGFTVDDHFTAATADAVRAWQDDLGVEQTGIVDVSQVVVAPGRIRVAAVSGQLGAPAAGPLLTYTGSTRLVQIALDVSLQDLVKAGIAATITLPDASTVSGRVSSVGAVATTTPGTNGGSKTTIAVEVTIADQDRLGSLDAAPVTVTLVSDSAENVLTVPVAALVALAEGGYGVQVVDGGQTRYVAVETGMFAGGRVEVSGAGIAEGTVVGVPK